MSDEEIARLGALGDVQSATGRAQGPLRDPKEMLPVLEKSIRAEALYFRGNYPEAASLAREVYADCPTCTQAVRVLAFSLIKLGETDDAIQILRASVTGGRGTFLIRSLAQALIIDVHDREGRYDEAIAEYTRAFELDRQRVGITAEERIQRVTDKANLIETVPGP